MSAADSPTDLLPKTANLRFGLCDGGEVDVADADVDAMLSECA